MTKVAPRRLRTSIRVRTLMLAVAVCGVAFAAIKIGWPWAAWRYHVDRAVESALANGPERDWGMVIFPPVVANPARKDELLYLRSDCKRVSEILLGTIERNDDAGRCVNAVETLRVLLRQPGTFPLRQTSLRRVLSVSLSRECQPPVESKLADLLAGWVLSTGLTGDQRRAILAHVKELPRSRQESWVGLLAEIGGREETLFLLELRGTDGDIHAQAIDFSSSLCLSIWPGMIPHLAKWPNQPQAAQPATRYSILSQTREGRNLLACYARDPSRPLEPRKAALERLQATIAGTEFLLREMSTDDRSWPPDLFSDDFRAVLEARLEKLRQYRGSALWSELIRGLAPGYWLPGAPAAIRKQVQPIRERSVELDLRTLRALSRRSDLTTQAEWQAWYASSKPMPVTQKELVQLVADDSAFIDNTAVLRRFLAGDMGGIRTDCLPLYEKIAREGSLTARYWACYALLHGSDRVDEVPIIFDQIAQARPNPTGEMPTALISLLRERFAENFFWDAAAWRRWWEKEQAAQKAR